MSRIRKLKTGRVRKTRLEIARYLMLRYAQEVKLVIKPGGADRLDFDEGQRDEAVIVFDPREGLTLLLHELGHWNTLERTKTAKSVIEEEVFAWEWAERAARRENLWFDYHKANEKFDSYAELHNVEVRIKWKYGL